MPNNFSKDQKRLLFIIIPLLWISSAIGWVAIYFHEPKSKRNMVLGMGIGLFVVSALAVLFLVYLYKRFNNQKIQDDQKKQSEEN